MAENEQEQAAEALQDSESTETGQDEPAVQEKARKEEKKDGGILMPILYALLAAIGTFTLIMFIAIGIMFFRARTNTPSEQPSSQESAPPSATTEPS